MDEYEKIDRESAKNIERDTAPRSEESSLLAMALL